jgi:SAM-dependent methyltransferase
VQDWQRFADKQAMWPYMSCAQFDAQRFPIRSDCLDCIDSTGAMSEIENSSLAMQEAFRTLKPGGKLFLSEGMLDPECAQAFPEEGRKALSAIGFGNAAVGYKEQLRSIGFNVVSYQQWGPRTPELGRSTLTDIAAKYGVQIRLYAVETEAQKP